MKSEWNKLDNAAKIFPAAQSKKDTQVFRFSCELYKTVNKDLLQKIHWRNLIFSKVY